MGNTLCTCSCGLCEWQPVRGVGGDGVMPMLSLCFVRQRASAHGGNRLGCLAIGHPHRRMQHPHRRRVGGHGSCWGEGSGCAASAASSMKHAGHARKAHVAAGRRSYRRRCGRHASWRGLVSGTKEEPSESFAARVK
eukprot:scaffold12843_cov113-Isochrysis_galbana.AAC.3